MAPTAEIQPHASQVEGVAIASGQYKKGERARNQKEAKEGRKRDRQLVKKIIEVRTFWYTYRNQSRLASIYTLLRN